MWLSAIVVCGVLGLSVVNGYQPEDPQGQAYPSNPSQFSNNPSSNSEGVSRPVADDSLVAQLDRLLKEIERIQQREILQKRRIRILRRPSDRNRAFQNKFEDIASKDINDEILDQNNRLYDLDQKLNTVRGLRAQVDRLQNTVEEVRDVTEKTIAADSRGGLNESSIANDIQEAYQEALTISAGLNEVAETVYDNTRQIRAQQLVTDQLIARLDFTTLVVTEVPLNVDTEGLATANVTNPGFPELYHGFLVGFEHRIRNNGTSEQEDGIDKEVQFSNPGGNVTQVLLIDNTPSHQDTVLVIAIKTGLVEA